MEIFFGKESESAWIVDTRYTVSVFGYFCPKLWQVSKFILRVMIVLLTICTIVITVIIYGEIF